MTSSLDAIKAALERGLALQEQATAAWHETGARPGADLAAFAPPDSLEGRILAQHACNFSLWHIEDEARRVDVDDAVIADCKRRIDRLNQQRNDGMERVDAALLEPLRPLLPASPGRARLNTESLGMAVDRLSILSLKIWHMEEQTRRQDADAAHISACAGKAAVLREQREDLRQAVLDLLDAYVAGEKQPKLYFQFKMYNDPTLNPALYGAKG